MDPKNGSIFGQVFFLDKENELNLAVQLLLFGLGKVRCIGLYACDGRDMEPCRVCFFLVTFLGSVFMLVFLIVVSIFTALVSEHVLNSCMLVAIDM